ncbi:hypothetical protein Taro_022290 [Colocasia esculenta]|uniref:Secreted protein n=1 Tax=Colocasia esculenta TaxID=4460 RepID=A0A843V113_COLES|nr:hypothetical protein [Colocasia esculenta]
MLVFVLRLWSLLVALVFRELRCLGDVRRGFASALCCSGSTPVAGRGVALVASTCRDSLSQEFVAGRSWWRFVVPCLASSVSCERECSL